MEFEDIEKYTVDGEHFIHVGDLLKYVNRASDKIMEKMRVIYVLSGFLMGFSVNMLIVNLGDLF